MPKGKHTWYRGEVPRTALMNNIEQKLYDNAAHAEGMSNNFIDFGVYDFLAPYPRTNGTYFTWDRNSVTFTGSPTATASNNIFYSKTELPYGMVTGTTYKILGFAPSTTKLWFGIRGINSAGNVLSESYLRSSGGGTATWTLPSEAVGLQIRVGVSAGGPYNETWTPKLVLNLSPRSNKTIDDYGMFANGVPVESTNLNTLMKTGYYMLATGKSYTNVPTGYDNTRLGLLEVFASGQNSTSSTFIQKLTSLNNKKIYFRYTSSAGSLWSEWEEL